MRRLALVTLLLAACAALLHGEPKPPARTHTVQLNGHTFTLPEGFTIELAAGPPLVDRPIVADFDDRGRLYVADSSGFTGRAAEQLAKKPHRIVRLEDTDGDGRFDKTTVFADHMMFPEGAMWYAGSLYVAAPPSIWKLTDTDGDGQADERSEWFQGKTLTGCANDLHGPYRGPDGWIYWCKGAFDKQTYERPGRSPFVTRASHIFRCRPDGSGIEPVMTGGMDNPVDVVFTPGGERIFTTTFFQHPGGGRRDGLIHAIYGGIYGKDHEPIHEHPWTSPALMPVLSHLGVAAPCGLTRIESNAFGPAYQDNVFACNFNLHRLTRHALAPHGATFEPRDEDFLVSSNLDFHPTDVLEDADGSLLVIDTGGWYKMCCPSSQLHKPDVLGAIYRIRRKGAPKLDDPRGRTLPWADLTVKELAGLLGDMRPAVRQRAVQTLASRGETAIPATQEVLHGSSSAEARRNAVWTATRIDQESARAAVREALKDTEETVRQTALHSISLRRDRVAVPELRAMLKHASAHNRRAAAEALGRIGDRSAVPALLEAAGEPADRALEHSLTYALIEIADRDGTAAGLQSENLRTRRAALVAIDQMEGGKLDVQAVARELVSSDATMKEYAWWIAARHPEWSGTLAGTLRDRLDAKMQNEAERQALVQQLARLSAAPAAQRMLAERLEDAASSREARRTVLRAMAQAGLRTTPDGWFTALTHLLQSGDRELAPEAVAAVRSLRTPRKRPEQLVAALLAIGRSEAAPADLRVRALAAIPAGPVPVDGPLFDFLRAQLNPEQPVALRSAAAEVMARAKLNAEQLVVLADSLKTAGPLELDRLLDPYAQSTDEKVGRTLLAALKAAPARSSLRTQDLKQRLAKYGAPIQEQAQELYAALEVDASQQKARLEQLLAGLKDGDIRRGQLVFNGTKAACSACHAIGYLGGNVGPDLTRIGGVRTARDLLESIAFPSASFVRSYEPVQITTKDGKVFNGLIRKDATDEVVLATGVNQETRIARDEIEAILPSKVSIMPAGLDQQLTPQELADLVTFLMACK